MPPVAALMRLLRPHQWIKNAFVFAPLFFAGQAGDFRKLLAASMAAFSFCLVASAIYVLNDVRDVAHDRLHPKKRMRPIASGEVSIASAIVIGLLCLAVGMIVAVFCAWPTVIVVGSYLAINIAYCMGLKQRAIADVFSVASGFVLRVLAGGEATGIMISQWLVIMTFLISLFLVLGKRRDDLTVAAVTGKSLRPALQGYTIPYVDVCMGLLTAVLVMSYILYCLSPDVVHRRNGQYVYLSTVLVLAGMFRYLQIAIVKQGSFSPTQVLYQDRFLKLVITAWVVFFALVIYC